MVLSVVLLWGIASWFGLLPQRRPGSAQPHVLIVVLDGGSSRLAAAERLRQRILHGDPQRGSGHEPDPLLIRCPRSSPVSQLRRELLQGYDTAREQALPRDELSPQIHTLQAAIERQNAEVALAVLEALVPEWQRAHSDAISADR